MLPSINLPLCLLSFSLPSKYKPAGDQPKAIEQLVAGLHDDKKFQTLLGVTGSGKTFTMANVIQQTQRPTLVIAHNKTLAAQLCNEFREFFPDNVVEYFVSYYDYYQPEAYMPRTDTYIEKEAMINEEIDRLRHAATQALLTRRDVIIVASVSCIYGLGSPKEYEETVLHLKVGPSASRTDLIRQLISMQFERTNTDLTRGHFRAKGDILEVMPTNEEMIYRLVMSDESIESIQQLDPVTRKILDTRTDLWIFPAKHYVVSQERKSRAIGQIRHELAEQLKKFEENGQVLEAERLSRRTRYDIEMIEQIGYCNGIENYSRFFDGRAPGEPPYTLLDYFWNRYHKNWMVIVDESHMTIPQIRGMYNGDRSRKQTLIDYGFRMKAAADNRPFTFDEFYTRVPKILYVSATPDQWELTKAKRNVYELLTRPTGIIDPEITIRPSSNQINDLISEIESSVAQGHKVLVTALTKRIAEDLTKYLTEKNFKTKYLHSDIKTLKRSEILQSLRRGEFDILVGINLLREGLDLPEIGLVAILRSEDEGFLRSRTALIQTMGRAARNINGKVIIYADKMTNSINQAVNEISRRRQYQ